MVTIIIYDIKAGPHYNKIKRNFYYHLKKVDVRFINKSVIEVNDDQLNVVLGTIKKHKKYIDAYVLEVNSIQTIE